MHLHLHEKLFGIIVGNIIEHIEHNRVDGIDWMFLEQLPEMAEIFGFEARMGTYIQVRLHGIIRDPKRKPKQSPQAYRYDPRVGLLWEEGYSVRQIVQILHSTKALVERGLRDYHKMPVQLVFDFYYEVQVIPGKTDHVQVNGSGPERAAA